MAYAARISLFIGSLVCVCADVFRVTAAYWILTMREKLPNITRVPLERLGHMLLHRLRTQVFISRASPFEYFIDSYSRVLRAVRVLQLSVISV